MSLKLPKSFLTAVILFSITFLTFNDAQAQKKKKHVVIGYVGGYNGRPINVDQIDAKKLTHINYAFVDCQDSMTVLGNIKTDTINFRLLNSLKKINPDLKILISIGGWTWSKHFSDAVLTPTSRVLFAKTGTDIIRRYNLDGIDIDWEYPGQRGDNNTFRPEDKQNFTLMFIEIRKELDKLSAETGKKYLLTAALNSSKNFIDHTEMGEVGKILDYANLMTYDMGGPGGTVGHHTNLYGYGTKGASSADKGIQDFIALGVPAEKLVIGVAFYGKGVLASTTVNNGLGEKRAPAPPPGTPAPRIPAGGYTFLKDSIINKKGYIRFWDKEAKAPYLFNAENKHFITYDDEESVKLKSKYVKKNKLAGAFFWQYSSDLKGYLLTVLDENLN
jgi:chitinase